jgi:hypothetical protein
MEEIFARHLNVSSWPISLKNYSELLPYPDVISMGE